MSTKTRLAKLRRVQELFETGAIATVAADDEVVPFWIAKPNSFERDEAHKDGRAARARRVLRYDRDEDEQTVVEAQMLELDRETIVASLIAAKGSEFYVKASNEIRTREDWRERLEVLDRGDALLNDRQEVDEADRELLVQVNREFMDEHAKLVDRFEREAREELVGLDEDALHAEYRRNYREMVGVQAFLEERRRTELYFAIRMCDATHDGEHWDHAKCNHRERFCEYRHNVDELPDPVLVACRTVFEALLMTPEDAGNSAAPLSSSASSERSSAEEESTPSSPAEMPLEPVGT